MTLLRPLQWTIAGTPAGLHAPLFLVAALAVALLTIWLARQALHRPLARGWVAPRLMSRLVPGRAPGREALKVALVGAGLALLAIACARPFWGEVKESVHRRGVDVVVALDASRSMMGQDLHPDRLTQARLAVESLIDLLHGDRIGLVAFAKDAFVQAPLTTDYGAARLYLRAVDPLQMQQGGTDLGGALSEARDLLSRGKKSNRQQVVVLLTDGEDWGESASAEAKALGNAGIKLFTVAVGTEAGAPVPILDARGRVVGSERDAAGEVVLTHANRAALSALAGEAAGQSFDLANDLGATALGHAIDTLQKGEIEEVVVSASAERFSWFAAPALALILLGLWLSPTRAHKLSPTLAALALAALPLQARADVFHVPEPAARAGAEAYAARHYDDALKQFQAKTQHAEVARFNQGDTLAALGRDEAALESFRTSARALHGLDAYNRGTLEAKARHPDLAIASLRQALIADPANEDARHNLEVLLAQQQQDQKDQKKNQPPKSGDSKDRQQAGSGEPKDKQDAKDQKQAGQEPKDQQKQPEAKGTGQQKNQTEAGQQKKEAPASPGALAQAGREPTRAERMLDALKAGDRLLPYRPDPQPERSPDAHPW